MKGNEIDELGGGIVTEHENGKERGHTSGRPTSQRQHADLIAGIE